MNSTDSNPNPSPDDDEVFEQRRQTLLRETPIPLIWLFGKTGSGKSSIIQGLTGATDAQIGNGFRPQTRSSMQFDFPDSEFPIARFLDTRGIAESGYDATVDMAAFDTLAHLMIVPVRVSDQSLEAMLKPLRRIRKANRHRPVLLVFTALHDFYPGCQHPPQNPFVSFDADAFEQATLSIADRKRIDDAFVPEVGRAIADKLNQFEGLFDYWAAIDLTRADDGLDQPDFGAEMLQQQVIRSLPAAYRQSIRQMAHLNESFLRDHRKQSHSVILAHSAAAASAAAIPIPWLDIPFVLGIQSRLAYRLAAINDQPLDAATIARFSAAIGGRVALQMGIREALKFIPWVGMAVNSASTFAWTYASGRAWDWYFTRVAQGYLPSDDELKTVFADQLKQGESFWKRSKENSSPS